MPARVPADGDRGLRDLLHAAARSRSRRCRSSWIGRRATRRSSRCRRRRAASQNDPVLGLVENLGLEGVAARRARDLRRRARGDDPLHRHERGRDRRVADHVRDGDATGSCPEVFRRLHPRFKTPWLVARGLRRLRLDLVTLLPGKVDFLGTMYSFGAMLSFTIAHVVADRAAVRGGRDEELVFRGAAEPAPPRRRLAALRAPRRARDRASPGSWSSCRRRRRATPASAGSRSASRATSSTAAGRARAAARDGAGAAGARAGARARVPHASSCPSSPGRASEEAIDVACRLAAERGARSSRCHVLEVPLDLPLDAPICPSRRGGRAHELLDDAPRDRRVATASTSSAASCARAAPAARSSREADARHARDRRPRRAAPRAGAPRRRVFGTTVDYVLKHAPCRVIVAAAADGSVNRFYRGRPSCSPSRSSGSASPCRASRPWHGGGRRRLPARRALRRGRRRAAVPARGGALDGAQAAAASAPCSARRRCSRVAYGEIASLDLLRARDRRGCTRSG